MGLLDFFKPKAQPVFTDAPGELEWVGAYVRPQEKADRWTVAGRADLLVARLLGKVANVVDMNANDCGGGSVSLRLYRKARSKQSSGKIVKGKRLKYLRGELYAKPDAKTIGYAEGMDGIEEVTDGPVVEFMQRPNAWMTGSDWMYLRFKAREACGNAYTFVSVNGKKVEAYWLPPQCVRIVADGTRPIALYRFSRNMTDWLNIEPEAVFHSKLRPSLQDFRMGDSWIHGLIKQIDILDGAHDAELARQRNGAQPSYFIELPANTTPDSREQIRRKLMNEHRGPSQAGRPMLGTAGMKIIPVGFAPKDLEHSKTLEYYDRLIEEAAGRPESVSKNNDASRANGETGLKQLARNTIAPRQCRDANDLTSFVLPLFNLTPGEYFFAYDNPVPEDEAAEEASWIAKINCGAVLLNEYRQAEGFEPYPDEIGGVPRFNGTPMQTAQQKEDRQQAQADALGAQKEGEVSSDGGKCFPAHPVRLKAVVPPDLEREIARLAPKVQKALRELAERAPLLEDGTPDMTEFREAFRKAIEEDERERFYRELLALLLLLLLKAGVDEQEAKRRAEALVKEERTSVSPIFAAYAAFAADRASASVAQGAWRARMTAEALIAERMAWFRQNPASLVGGSGGLGGIGGTGGGSGGAGGSGGSGGFGSGSGATPPQPSFGGKLGQSGLLDRLEPNTTAQQQAELAEEMAWQSVLEDVAPRSERIAEYETYSLENLGRLVASDLAGYTWLQWYTFDDERVCPECNAMVDKLSKDAIGPDVPKEIRGKPVQRVDVPYQVPGAQSVDELIAVFGPPLHFGCRCVLEPVLTELVFSTDDTVESATARWHKNKTRLYRMFEQLYRAQVARYERERNQTPRTFPN